MHSDHQVFIAGIHARRRVVLYFYSKDDHGALLTRSCAPMDYGPRRKAAVQVDRYHFWDFDSDTGSHTLGIVSEQIDRIVATQTAFDPADFVTWQPRWLIPREWGSYG